MSRLLARMPIAHDADIVSVRQCARHIAELLGFDRQAQTRIATAVSEIARNAFHHGGGGEIEFAVDAPARPELFRIRIGDHGPGFGQADRGQIAQVDTANAQGIGLVSARRLVDHFEIESSREGTTVRIAQRLPAAAAARLSSEALDAIAARLPGQADPLAVLHEQNREIIDSLAHLHERQAEAARLNRELEDTNRGVVALYSELEQKAEQLRSASDMKSRFLSNMSHEFRTPLNSILALARLLIDGIDGPLNPEQARQVEYIRRATQGLLDMVNDLLDLAKVEAGKIDVRPAPLRVGDLFASLRGSLKPLQVNPAVELTFVEAPELPELLADEQKVAQILRNLISNALKFTERGHVRVSARHDPQHQRIVFAVEDSGIGIEAQALATIFEEFTQVPGALQRGGTGLGLPLSRRLAQLMGGDVTVLSEPRVGSTFELFLPVCFGSAGAPQREVGAAAPRLLVVDDEEAFRYVIRHIAHDAGFQVLEAHDGEAGLTLAHEQRPDIVILDLQMPRMDGFAMLDALARDGGMPPVIVCTSQALSLDQKRALAAAHAIVPKHEVSRDSLTALLHATVTSPEVRP
ncbi:MAG TPA: ATP-binding protein [Burkholderiaceae bacterium]|nr:ATP-binding protein [Burkholderiaceae bacterium]